jgi:FtsZ-interacting cell division protein YlmF
MDGVVVVLVLDDVGWVQSTRRVLVPVSSLGEHPRTRPRPESYTKEPQQQWERQQQQQQQQWKRQRHCQKDPEERPRPITSRMMKGSVTQNEGMG